MAVSYTIRNATTTNSAGHSYNGGTFTYSVTRYWNRFDLSGWDGNSSANYNGTTEDGSIAVGWVEGDTPPVMQ